MAEVRSNFELSNDNFCTSAEVFQIDKQVMDLKTKVALAPKYNIRVTAIQPGAVATELYDHITEQPW